MSKIQVIICNTCNANIAAHVLKYSDKKWEAECKKYTKNGFARLETVDEVSFEQKLKSCCGRTSKTVTPGLRIDYELWKSVSNKYPRQINRMFTEWIKSL